MKRKMGISLLIVILMVVSTFTITTARTRGESSSSLVVSKTIWNGESWSHEICDIVTGDVIQFNITVTFHNYNPCENNYIYDIVVEDYLPDGLEYKDTISPRAPNEIVDNKITWSFTDDEIILQDDESFSIIFRAVATEYGEQSNEVYSYATEFCCGEELNSYDYAEVYVEPMLDVDKKVWDPDAKEWVERLDSVITAADVRFQIEITYHGPGYITCMEVVDTFIEECSCLEYLGNEEFIYPNDNLFDDPKITVPEDLKGVTYTWSSELGILFNLADGQSIIIRFDADVTNYCYCEEGYNTVTNIAQVDAWNCADCEESLLELEGCDSAEVCCRPHEPVFEKSVKYIETWTEEATAQIGYIVKFKIRLTYYGDYSLSDIVVIDTLPKNILEYAEGSDSLMIYRYYESGVEIITDIQGVASEDKAKIEWDIDEVLGDCDTLELTFGAIVIGLTGDCECCGTNTAEYTAIESVTEHPYSGEDTAKVITSEKIPVKIDISAKRFSVGQIRVSIKNVGEAEASNLKWNISVSGGIRGKINVNADGTIEDLESGRTASVYTVRGPIKHGFGRVKIKITVTVGETIFEETAKGFVLGRLIIIRPLLRK